MGGYIVYIGVLLYSLGGYLTGAGFGWNVEALGFFYGYLLGDKRVKKKLEIFLEKEYAAILICSTVFSLMLGVAYLKFKTVVFWGEFLLRTLLGIALVLLVFTLLYRMRLSNKVSDFLGTISYEIYLLHGLAICVLSLAGDRLPSGMFIVATVLATVLVAVPFHAMNQAISKKIKEIEFK